MHVKRHKSVFLLLPLVCIHISTSLILSLIHALILLTIGLATFNKDTNT